MLSAKMAGTSTTTTDVTNHCSAMPSQSGFDRDKFVDSKDEIDEFLCAICQGIFRDPKVTQCCGQTYCHNDINQWLDAHSTCPNCRKRLTAAQLMDPPKALKNLWSKLKMRCEYSEQGCIESVCLEDMTTHMTQCDYRPNAECKTCGIVKISVKGHNCVESLKKANKALIQKQVKDQDNFNRKLKKLEESLRQKFRKELEDLKAEVAKENEDHDKYIRRKFIALHKKWDINEQSGPSKAKRSLPDSYDSSRPKKRIVPPPDPTPEPSESEGELSIEEEEESDDEQTGVEEVTDASASEAELSEPLEQEESDQEIGDSDSQ